MHHDFATRSPLPALQSPPQPSLHTYTRNSLRNTWVLVCLLVLSLYALAVHAQTANDGFNPSSNGEVLSSFVQSDGKIVVGGVFTTVGGASRVSVARLNIDGSADPGFNPGSGPNFDGNVNVVADGASGRVLVGGSFTQFNGTPAPLIVRLGINGAVDGSFLQKGFPSGFISAIAVQPDGNILMGGQFTNFGRATNLDRLDGNGTPDQNFAVNVNGPVFSIAVLPNGKILIGGSFTTVNGQTRTNFARLNSNGSLDTSYDAVISGVNSQVSRIVVQPDGKAIVAGFFDKVGSVSRQSIVRLNTNGSLDTSFEAVTLNGNILTVALQSDGKVLIGGGFGSVNDVTQAHVSRLNQNGTLDPLHVNKGASVRTISLQADGSIILGGSFFTINDVQCNGLARLTPAGFLDDTFDRDASGDALNGSVSAIAIRAGGEVVVGGEFTNTSPGPAFMQRLAPDGRRIIAPSAPLNGPVRALAIQADGKIIRGGSFSKGIDREIPGVGPDTLFNPGGVGIEADASINAIAMLDGGQILIAGRFFTYNGVPRRNIARLNPDGTLDSTFIGPSALGGVNALTVQFDGKILVGGFGYLLRLNRQGNVDTTFNVSMSASGSVSVISISEDENVAHIFIGGSFSQVNGVSAGNLAMLTIGGVREPIFAATTVGPVFSMIQQRSGRLIIGGAFTSVNGTARQRLAVVSNATGVLLGDYSNADVGGVINALALQPDGKLLIGGNFTTVQLRNRSHIARFSAVRAVRPNWLMESGSNGAKFVTFDIKSGYAELTSLVKFELSTDATNWTSLGDRAAHNGVVSIFLGREANLPIGRTFYLRASTRVPSGQGNGSSSPYEQIKQFYLPSTDARDLDGDAKSDLIFRNGSTGQLTGWIMDGLDTLAAVGLVPPGNWTVSHTADFSGDGKADILFRNDDGSSTLWLMDGLTVTETKGLLGPNPDWRATHVGDFDGDGKADILWRNINGAVTLWLMDGTTIKRAVGLLGPNPDWSVSHVGDFNGDTAADILWRNTNGAVTMWLSVNPDQNIFTRAGLLGPNPDWSVSHVGDFNGDGKADLLWRNTNGAVTMWLMNGAAQIAAAGMLGPNPDWRVSHVADFNGDGNADLLWRNNNGAVTQWLMDGVSAFTITGLLGADPNWRVTHTGDYNGDGKADLLWRNLDGSITMWQMDGSVIKQTGGLLGPGPWFVVPAQ